MKSLFECIDALDDVVGRNCRRVKVQALYDECVSLQHSVAEKNSMLSDHEEEGVRAEALANAEQIDNRCKNSLQEARTYLLNLSPTKSKGFSKRSKTSSKVRELELKLREEELERQAEAEARLLKAEHNLKLLKLEESKRKQIQAAKDQACLESLKDDESENGDLGSVISVKDNPFTNTENWVNSVVDQNANTAAAMSLAPVRSLAFDLTKPNESVLPPSTKNVTSSSSVPVSFVSSSFPGPVQNVTRGSVSQLVPSNAPYVSYSRPMSSAQTLNPIQSVSFGQHLPHITTNAGFVTNTATVVPPVPNIQTFYDTRFLQESLPKLSLDSFSGDPLKWPEWKGMFEATCCHPSVSNEHKMRYLKLCTTGKARSTIEGYGYSGVYFDQAFAALQRRFGSPHLVVSAQIEKMNKHPVVKMHNSDAIIEFSQIVNAFVSVLSSEGYFSDLQSSSNMSLVVSKLPINLKGQWFAFLERGTSVANLVTFRDWLQQKAVVHGRLLMSSGKQERSELKAPGKIKKHTVFATNTSSSTPNNALSFPVCQEVHKVWKCKWFLEKSVKDRIAFVREKKLCFSCLQSGQFRKIVK